MSDPMNPTVGTTPTVPTTPTEFSPIYAGRESEYLSWPDCWRLFAMVGHVLRRAILWGPPSTGKTKAAEILAVATNRPLYSITLTELTSAAELRGHFIPRGAHFEWHDGPAIRAWRDGGVLVLNEIDHASSDVANLMYGILDKGAGARITLPTGETVTPHPDFVAFATTNEDPSQVLTEALMSRFQVKLCIDEAHPDAIASLPASLQTLAKELATHADPERRITIRELLAFAELAASVGDLDVAAAATLGSARGAAVVDAIRLAKAGE